MLFSFICIGQSPLSPSDYNEESIVDENLWEMFVSIGGFSNLPNATGHSNEILSVELSDIDITHNITLLVQEQLNYEDYQNQKHIMHEEVAILEYHRIEGNQNQTRSLGTVSFGQREGGEYSLTVMQDNNGNLHIFWKREYTPEDVPSRYYLFYSQIDSNGTILEKNTLVYFEQKGSGLPELNYDFALITLLIVIIIIVIVAVMLQYKRKTKRK